MLLEGPCPDFAYVTVLRDPVARLQSQLERMSDRPNHRLHELLSRPHVYNHSETSSLMGTAALDNYLIRMLLGPSVFFLPLRAINASHLKAATAVLSRFAAAVPLDALDGDGAALLRTVLHWRGTPHRANGHRAAWSRQQPQPQPQPQPQQGAEGRRLAPLSTRGSTAAAARAPGPARGAQLQALRPQTLRPPLLGERSLRLLRELNRCSSLSPGLSPSPSPRPLLPGLALALALALALSLSLSLALALTLVPALSLLLALALALALASFDAQLYAEAVARFREAVERSGGRVQATAAAHRAARCPRGGAPQCQHRGRREFATASTAS